MNEKSKKMKWLKIILVILVFYPFWGGIISGAYTFFYGEIHVEKVVMISFEEGNVSGKRFIAGYSDILIYTNKGNYYRVDTSLLDNSFYSKKDKILPSSFKIITKKNRFNFLQVAQENLIFYLEIEGNPIVNKFNSLYIYYKSIFYLLFLVFPLVFAVFVFFKIRKILNVSQKDNGFVMKIR